MFPDDTVHFEVRASYKGEHYHSFMRLHPGCLTSYRNGIAEYVALHFATHFANHFQNILEKENEDRT